MFTHEQKQELKQLIQEVLDEKGGYLLHQSQFVPDVVKREAIEDRVVVFGEAADRPTDETAGIEIYFETDDNVLAIYDGSEWVEFPRIPASPSAYTQTYSTAERTHAASTFAAVAETGATQTTPWGYGSEAQANSITVELNDLNDDVVDLKQLVNALIDDLQSIGLVS